jgi:hypothetical protein
MRAERPSKEEKYFPSRKRQSDHVNAKRKRFPFDV